MSWYKKAKKIRKPYKIYVLAHGVETYIDTVWAYSSEQARMLAVQEKSKLRDYLQMGYEIIARLDREKLEEIQKYQKMKEEMREEQIQDAWWQD